MRQAYAHLINIFGLRNRKFVPPIEHDYAMPQHLTVIRNRKYMRGISAQIHAHMNRYIVLRIS
jgi:hypothetical protein